MGGACCSFVPDQYDPYESPIISEALLHAADIVCCSVEMRQAFVRFLLGKAWLPKYLERQRLGLTSSTAFDLPEGRILAAHAALHSERMQQAHRESAAALYRAKSEMFRSKRSLSMNSRSESTMSHAQTARSGEAVPLPKQDPLLALAESFIIFLVAGVLPQFLISTEFLEWADARPLSSGQNSPRQPDVSSLALIENNSDRRRRRGGNSGRYVVHSGDNADCDGQNAACNLPHNRKPERRSSTMSVLMNGLMVSVTNQNRRYFAGQTVDAIRPLVTGEQSEPTAVDATPSNTLPATGREHDHSSDPVSPPSSSPPTTRITPLIVHQPSSEARESPATGQIGTSAANGSTTPLTAAVTPSAPAPSSEPLNESARMERIIHEVLDVVNVGELDDMLRSTDWLRALLQTLDELPISVSVAQHVVPNQRSHTRGINGDDDQHDDDFVVVKKPSRKMESSVTATSLSVKLSSKQTSQEFDSPAATNGGATNKTALRHPLVYVNTAFERLTLYSREQVLGHSCHILQDRKHSELSQVTKIQTALHELHALKVGITNVRQDRSQFFNLLSMKPLVHHDKHGGKYCKHILMIQYAVEEEKVPEFNEFLAIDDLLRLLSNVIY